jgi:phage tail sheath protein FI
MSKKNKAGWFSIRQQMIESDALIQADLQNFLFEPNDESTRYSVHHAISSRMESLMANNVIVDYAVVCDEVNNGPRVIDSNRLHVDVAVKPMKTAEFMMLNYVVSNSDATPENVLEEQYNRAMGIVDE